MWASVLFLKGLVYSFCKFISLQLCQMAIFMFPGGLVQWLQNVPCYHEVIGRRPRFGHHTGCETSKKPVYRSKYTFKKNGCFFNAQSVLTFVQRRGYMNICQCIQAYNLETPQVWFLTHNGANIHSNMSHKSFGFPMYVKVMLTLVY